MDKMREGFESWMSEYFNGASVERRGYGYIDPISFAMWISWQASRAELCVELPSFENGSIRGYSGDCDEARMIVDSVAESLDKAGASYK